MSRIYFLAVFLSALQVALASGGPTTGNRYSDSLIWEQASSSSSSSFSASYGQLYFSTSAVIDLNTASEWVSIPFDAFGPSSNVNGSTTPPARITILESGTYEMNVSLYFSSDVSIEDTFNQTTYTLGISINGGDTVPYSAVYAGEAGHFSLNFSTIKAFSANDYLQFYMETSAVGGSPFFDNIVTLIAGNAYLVQIAK